MLLVCLSRYHPGKFWPQQRVCLFTASFGFWREVDDTLFCHSSSCLCLRKSSGPLIFEARLVLNATVKWQLNLGILLILARCLMRWFDQILMTGSLLNELVYYASHADRRVEDELLFRANIFILLYQLHRDRSLFSWSGRLLISYLLWGSFIVDIVYLFVVPIVVLQVCWRWRI